MQQHSILATKLYIPPLRPELVSRPRLIERLNGGRLTRDAFPRALTLVSAPAGFGKTTLLSEWVRDSGRPVAWLSLDDGDNDPPRFLAYLIAALRTLALPVPSLAEGSKATGIEPRPECGDEIGRGVLSALQSPEPPPAEALLTSLINELAAIPDSIVLVLDDYHLIEAQAVHDALTFLLEHLPPQVHLVIATREDPPLFLARLRARGQLTELRALDLRFTSSEAAELLNRVMGLDLPAEDIAALERRTEGWVAGLQLASLALQGIPARQGTSSMQGRKDASSLVRSFTGSHRFVLDYLIEEVLEQQPESVQTFLLQTAILDRLTGSLCDALRSGSAKSAIEQGRGQAILESLERANLFIVPLDEERRWYRYHHLFADLLRQRLRQTQAQQVPALHQRASAWYEQNGFVDEAIDHALRAGDFERAADLVGEQVDAIWQSGMHAKLWRWLEELPADLVSSRPDLCVFRARYLVTSGQPDAAEQSLQAAEQALGVCTDRTTGHRATEMDHPGSPDRQKLQGRIAVTRALSAFFQGDLPQIVRHARQALEYLPEQDSAWRSNAAIALGDAYRIQGNMEAAYSTRLEALEISKAAGNVYMVSIASMKLAVTMRQQGRLQQVIEMCEQQLRMADECGLSQTAIAGGFLAILGEVLAELDDLEAALDRSTRGVELAESGEDMVVLGWSYLCLMRVLCSREDMAGVEALVQRVENHTRESDIPPWITTMMTAWRVRLELAQGNLESASRWLADHELDIDTELQFLHELEQTLLARILVAQGRLDEATRLLHHLFESAEAEKRISSLIEILILQALVLQAQGDAEQACSRLQRALVRGRQGGFVRTFVDEGPPMARLLHQALSRQIAPDYVRRLLAAFPDAEPEQTAPPVAKPAYVELVEPLSDREAEVLQLIAQGLTNREIASRLYLSLNTIKAHTRNIYGKLDVHSRTQAILRARTLGILPSV